MILLRNIYYNEAGIVTVDLATGSYITITSK